MDRTELEQIALEAARKAVAVHVAHVGTVDRSEWAEKGAADFVTRVDHEAEQRVLTHIRACCPGHEFLAEESTTAAGRDAFLARFREAEWLWIIDPLDGTTNYLHAFPQYSASVAVAHHGEVVAGAVIDGTTGAEWSARAGGGARRNGQPIRVSTIDRLDHALIGTGFPFKVLDLLPTYLRQFDAVLRNTSGVRRGGSAALDLCHLASGWLDGFWEMWLAPWDVAAGTLIVREAGGLVTSLKGDPDVRAAGAILAGNPTMHRELKRLLDSIER